MTRHIRMVLLSAIVTLSACASSTTGSSSTTPSSTSSARSTAPAPSIAPATTTASTQATPTSPPVLTVEVSSTSGVTTDASDKTTLATSIEQTIVADYQTDQNLYWAVVFSPSTDNLEARVGEFSVPGEQIFAAVVQGVQDLVKVGDAYVPNSPDLRHGSVERVDLDGASDATLTICTVDNSKRITPASNSPTSSEIDEDNTGQLAATRSILRMHLSSGRWLLASYPGDALGIWKGQDHCEPA